MPDRIEALGLSRLESNFASLVTPRRMEPCEIELLLGKVRRVPGVKQVRPVSIWYDGDRTSSFDYWAVKVVIQTKRGGPRCAITPCHGSRTCGQSTFWPV
jgi:hypothetical protein